MSNLVREEARKGDVPVTQRSMESPSATMKIDICRGIFSFLVAIAHSLMVCRAIYTDQFRELPVAVDRFLYLILENGIYWVMGFFVISGYCIFLSVQRLVQLDRFRHDFYLRARLSRILPLYYVALAFTLVVEFLIAPHRPRVWPNGLTIQVFFFQILGIQNFTQTFGLFGPSWSITNELFYYIFFGGLIVLAGKNLKRAVWLGTVLSIIGASLAQLTYATVYRTPPVLTFGLLLGLGINWFSGALVALYAPVLLQWAVIRWLSRFWAVLLTLMLGLRYLEILPNQPTFLLAGMIFSLMLLSFLNDQPERTINPRQETWSRIANIIGLASYPTYLFHGGIIMLLGSLILTFHPLNDWRLTWAVLSGASIVSGLLLGVLVERPLMTWRSGYLRKVQASYSQTQRDETIPRFGRSHEMMEPTT